MYNVLSDGCEAKLDATPLNGQNLQQITTIFIKRPKWSNEAIILISSEKLFF